MINEIDVYYWGVNGYEKSFTSSYIHLSLFFRILLKGYKIKKYKKVVIKLIEQEVETINNVEIKRELVTDLGEVVEIWKDLRMGEFMKKALFERKNIIWNYIKDSLIRISEEYNIDTRQIEEAYRIGIVSRLECALDTGLETYDKKRQLWASILITCDERNFKFYVIKKDISKSEIDRKLIAKFSPLEGFEKVYYLKKIKWKNAKLSLYLKSDEYYEVDL